MTCKVAFCKHINTHTTLGHLCPNCNQYGHGYIECQNQVEIDNLRDYDLDILPKEKWCIYKSCKSRKYHMTESHHCEKCFLNHCSDDCLIQPIEILDQKYDLPCLHKNFNEIFKDYKNSYLSINLAENILFIRIKNDIIDGLYINVNDYNYSHYKNKFIDKLYYLGDFQKKLNNIIKCPICRNQNDINNISIIKGSSENCKICLTNNIEIYFMDCQHACVCRPCFNKLTNL